MNWMLLPLRRYADFSDRSRPKEYWMFVLFIVLASIAASVIDVLLGFGTATHVVDEEPNGFWASAAYSGTGPVLLLFTLAILVPSLAVGVRRLHDSDRSGWWLLIGLIPFVGSIVLLVFMILSGTRGPNRFGPDPVQAPLA
jgi:uncharacterized membrane protein YhaH (DUF805 family)